jgi:hypothetical protein
MKSDLQQIVELAASKQLGLEYMLLLWQKFEGLGEVDRPLSSCHVSTLDDSCFFDCFSWFHANALQGKVVRRMNKLIGPATKIHIVRAALVPGTFCTLCSLSVLHSLFFILCSLSVHALFTLCTLSVYSLSALCSSFAVHSVHALFTLYTLAVHSRYTLYSLSVHNFSLRHFRWEHS